ncbi:MAG: hypothetical protein JSV67_02235 [Thermoplasmatales archaeon]|jgi:KaiC/GvpD/RAD55 family RecA-like ATPase|nr:MAG: hypothetical protein JSV67_02235 [Thermoplasmatales archaeon]
MDAGQKLEEEYNGIPDDYIVFLETRAENSFEVSTALVKYLSNRNDRGIVVSANRPYANLVNVYMENGIDVSRMFILDCLSKSQHAEKPAENVVFIENLSALTDISLSLDENMNNMSGRKFIFFDSLTTMLIHNKPYVLARFIHNIFTKMRLKGVGGALISLQDNSNRDIRAEIAQLCDKVIKI